jgi:hypothetical protein
MKVYQPNWFLNLKFWAFLGYYFERIEIFFFHRKNQLKKIKNSFIFELDGMFKVRLLRGFTSTHVRTNALARV